MEKTSNDTKDKQALCRGCNSLKTGLWTDFSRLRLDKRTKLARTVSFLKDELIKHTGGEPSFPQQLLIDRIAWKAVRCHLYEHGYSQNPAQGSIDYYISITNSLRLDLAALGMTAKNKEPMDLTSYLQKREAEDSLAKNKKIKAKTPAGQNPEAEGQGDGTGGGEATGE